MTLPARFSGRCPDCGGTWQPGDLIRADEHEPGTQPRWQHAACPDDDPLDATHPVCPSCWLTHPEGMECDSW